MRHLIRVALAVSSIAFVPWPSAAHDVNISVRTSDTVRTCDDLEVTFDDQAAVTAVDRLAAPGGQKLSVRASQSGGVYVFGSSRSDFAISVCKAVAPQTRDGGESALESVRASLSGGTLSATGPATGWLVYFIIDAPSSASIDLEASNGPLYVAQVAGSTTARSQNGPIKLLELSGHVSAHAENGPIAYEGRSGTIELGTQNGPLAVRLAGDKWGEGRLTATAQNGPVNLQVPRGFASGVRVHSSNHSPWKCRGCADGRRTWDDSSRSVELGSGPVAVTLSTVNGPVAVDLTQ
jgi:hypothetical protein